MVRHTLGVVLVLVVLVLLALDELVLDEQLPHCDSLAEVSSPQLLTAAPTVAKAAVINAARRAKIAFRLWSWLELSILRCSHR